MTPTEAQKVVTVAMALDGRIGSAVPPKMMGNIWHDVFSDYYDKTDPVQAGFAVQFIKRRYAHGQVVDGRTVPPIMPGEIVDAWGDQQYEARGRQVQREMMERELRQIEGGA
jgi:hypothetical protein